MLKEAPVLLSLREFARAIETLEAATALTSQLLLQQLHNAALEKLAGAVDFQSGVARMAAGRPTDAIPRFRQAVERFQTLFAVHPEDKELPVALSYAYTHLGNAQRIGGLFSDAETSYAQAVPLIVSQLAALPGNPVLHGMLVRVRIDLGRCLERDGRWPEAAKLYEDLLAESRQVQAIVPSDPRIEFLRGAAHDRAANAQRRLGQCKKAAPNAAQALTIAEGRLAKEGADKPGLALALSAHLTLKDCAARAHDTAELKSHQAAAARLQNQRENDPTASADSSLEAALDELLPMPNGS